MDNALGGRCLFVGSFSDGWGSEPIPLNRSLSEMKQSYYYEYHESMRQCAATTISSCAVPCLWTQVISTGSWPFQGPDSVGKYSGYYAVPLPVPNCLAKDDGP